MRIARMVLAAAAAWFCMITPAFAQDSNYTPGTVWEYSNVQLKPGQFERYVDWLAVFSNSGMSLGAELR